MKKFVIFLFIALVHFGLSVMIMPLTMSVAGALNAAQSASTMGLKTLVAVTRILHFPIISLSWYSRQWFPGNWIRLPMLINSCLWAAGILWLVIVCRKMRGKLY
ncbi:MAG: hypothetical protein V2J65_38250 [Desulfobacteraceae bacterium]|jgi:hypothetical protein|nr:hypothetical protein [Desulfobacteraceae bacterium]